MAGPAPAVAASRTAVRAVLDRLPPGPVLVACSGGADSLALAAATAFVAPRADRTAGAVVVDHAWHPGSAQVALRAATACRGLGLAPAEVVPAPDAARSEASARAARYAALADAARRHGAAGVLLGHTLDDQAESVLLGLARGSGGRSLSGMAADTVLPTGCGDVRVLRPLLGLRRRDTEAACVALGLAPWHDPANDDPAHARSRLRAASALLDDLLGPGLAEALARTADLLREDAGALDAAARALLVRAGAAQADALAEPDAEPDDDPDDDPDAEPYDDPDADPDGARPVDLDVAVLAAAPDAVRRRALLLAARRAGCPAGALGRRHALALDALVVAWRGQGAAHLPGRVEARRSCGRLWLARNPAPTTE